MSGRWSRRCRKQECGLFTLPLPEPDWEQKYGKPKLDIVAVHGLNGDCIRSWTSESPTGDRTTWLHQLLPHKLPCVRVMTFGYNASVLGNTSVAGVRENARMLLSSLRDKREDNKDANRPIIFIGHSLGGIIIKQALRIANNEWDTYGDIADCTKGVVFFGTPHRGATAAKWANSVANVLATTSVTKPRTLFLKVLKPNSKDLLDISEDFRSIVTRYAIVSFVEEDKFPGLGRVVVERQSAVMEIPHEEAVMISGSHSSMCKFDRDDKRFDAVWKCIRRIAESPATELQLQRNSIMYSKE